MAIPSRKHPDIEAFLEVIGGRTTAIEADRCVNPPFGCGKLCDGFDDDLSRKEFTISGLCQECQNEIFGT